MVQEQYSIEEIKELLEEDIIIVFFAVFIKYYLERNKLEQLWRYLNAPKY